MTNDVEEMLREGIDRLTAGAAVPDGLARRARRHYQHRRIAIRATATAGVAATAAAAVIAATASTGQARQGSILQYQTTAYVTSRAAQALAAAARSNTIQEIHTTGHHVQFSLDIAEPTGSTSHVNASRLDVWAYRHQYRQEGLSADGGVVFDYSDRTVRLAPGRVTLISSSADYRSKTWSRSLDRELTAVGSGSSRCALAIVPPPINDGASAAQIRAALACRDYRVAGRQHVDGVNAIKLVLAHAKAQPGIAGIRQTLWVDPSTYLPVREETTSRGGAAIVGDFRWLRPTAASLARLNVTIPAGFTRTSSMPWVSVTWAGTELRTYGF